MVSIPLSVSATEIEDTTIFSGDVRLLSVEVMSNEDAEALFQETINRNRSAYGNRIPTSTYDLSQGDYYFDGTYNSVFYGDWLFTGHNGSLQFKFFENSYNNGDFILKVFKKGLLTTTVYNAGVSRDANSTVNISTSASSKIYFLIDPDGTAVEFTEGTRLI